MKDTKDFQFDPGMLDKAPEEQKQEPSLPDVDFERGDEDLNRELKDTEPPLEFDESSLTSEDEPTKEKEDTPEEETISDEDKKEEEAEPQETNSEPPSDAASSSSSSDQYAPVIAKALHAEGVLSEFDEESFASDIEKHGEAKALLNLFEGHISSELSTREEQLRQQYDSGLTEDQRRFQEMLKDGIPYDEAKEIMTGYKRYDGISDEELEENESLAKSVLRDSYKETTRWSDTQIDRYISKLDEEELTEEAKESRRNLVSMGKEKEQKRHQEAKQLREQQEKQQKELAKSIQDTVYGMDDVGGMKVDSATREKVYKSMSTPVDYVNGQPVNSLMKKQYDYPAQFTSLHALYNEIGLYNFDKNGNPSPDFSKLQKHFKTDGITMLEKQLKGKQVSHGTSKAPSPPKPRKDTNPQASFLESLQREMDSKSNPFN